MENNDKRKAILYARFSPRRNEETCQSIETQFDLIKDYCKKNNIEIKGKFSDEALSGDDENRPGLWTAIGELRKDYLLVVYKLDRLARDVYLSQVIERVVGKHGAKILSIGGEGTWEDTPEQKMIRQILQVFAEYERKVIGARTKAAMLRYQNGGRLMTCKRKPPYGQMLDIYDSTRTVPNPDEQKAIKTIVKLRQAGMGLREICRELTNLKIKPRLHEKVFNGRTVKVYSKWSHFLISNILRRANAS